MHLTSALRMHCTARHINLLSDSSVAITQIQQTLWRLPTHHPNDTATRSVAAINSPALTQTQPTVTQPHISKQRSNAHSAAVANSQTQRSHRRS